MKRIKKISSRKAKILALSIASFVLLFYIISILTRLKMYDGFIDITKATKETPQFYTIEEFGEWQRAPLESLESANGEMGFDLRSHDISSFDFASAASYLDTIVYDNHTTFPLLLPAGFDPAAIMEDGKNPGLGIRNLQAQGITGKGVNIAIIDQGLLLSHKEYADNLITYEWLHQHMNEGATMHGAAVSSIAVGKECGVAPDANLYYIASVFADINKLTGSYRENLTPMADSINYILKRNEALPKEQRIHVISISKGITSAKGGRKVMSAINKAKEQGVFVITTSMSSTYGVSLMGLGRTPLSDPDNVNSYYAGTFWRPNYLKNKDAYKNMLLVPMDTRTTATFTGEEDYVFYGQGGLSWAVPWLSGMYALCLQENPDLTPELFLQHALATGSTVNGLGAIINPEELIKAVKAK